MARVCFGSLVCDVSLVAFDKDGTLTDFEAMWGTLARAWAERLANGPNAEIILQEIYRSWGYDRVRLRTLPSSPLAIAATHQLQTIAAATLYRSGIAWPDAEDRVRSAFKSTESTDGLTLAELLRPAGNARALMQDLRAAGVRVAIVTTDHRAETEETLKLLGLSPVVDDVVCGDDGLTTKPAPDMLLAACRHLGIAPNQAAVVGDTEADLLMAQRAGSALRAAVLTGVGDPVALEQFADVVLASIDDVSVCQDRL